ncbi:MAG: hypothetical protein ACYDC3_03840 [Candidatus Binataceae bacterium]
MGDGVDKKDIPMIHANIVTSNMNVDELTMELRWVTAAHRNHMKTGDGLIQIPPLTTEEVMAVEPVVRISMTFTAARALKHYLDQALPEIEKTRRSQ